MQKRTFFSTATLCTAVFCAAVGACSAGAPESQRSAEQVGEAGDARPSTLRIAPDADDGLRAALEQSVVDGCVACHKGDLGFGGRSVEDLDRAIAEITQGRAEHLVPIAPLGDADRRLLAEALVDAQPAP